MTADEFDVLKAECDRRNFNMTQLVALANILPFIGYYKVVHGKSHGSYTELTYCGKTRKEWREIRRKRLTRNDKERIKKRSKKEIA